MMIGLVLILSACIFISIYGLITSRNMVIAFSILIQYLDQNTFVDALWVCHKHNANGLPFPKKIRKKRTKK